MDAVVATGSLLNDDAVQQREQDDSHCHNVVAAGLGRCFKQGETVKKLMSKVAGFVRDENGTETLEWGLVCGLLVIGAITAIGLIGPKITAMWNKVDAEIK